MKVYLPEQGAIYVNKYDRSSNGFKEVKATWYTLDELTGLRKLLSSLIDNGRINEIPSKHNHRISMEIFEDGHVYAYQLITLDEFLGQKEKLVKY